MTNFANELDRASARAIEDFVQLTQERPAEGVLYHYTDAAGLLGILDTNTIRATDARFMNDPLELSYGTQVLADECAREWGQLYTTTSRFLGELAQVRELLNDRTGYLASFSTHADQLSQWRGYASDGNGYAIGIKPTLPFKALPRRPGSIASWLRVRYSEVDQRDLLKKALTPVAEVIERFNSDPDFDERKARRVLENLVNLVVAAVKQPGFLEESEWRLFVHRKAPEDTIRLRPSPKGIIPYVEVSTRDESPLPIVEVVLGPRLGVQASVAVAEALMAQRYKVFLPLPGADPRDQWPQGQVRVRKSKIQYG